MTQKDFMFTIGYQGNAALVDKSNMLRFSGKSQSELLEAGMFKPAFCRALYLEDLAGMEGVLAAYNAGSPRKYQTLEDLKRAFGVFYVPKEISRSIYL